MTEAPPPPPVDYNVLPPTQPSRSRPWLPVTSAVAVLVVVAAAVFLTVGRGSGGASLADAAMLVHGASGKAAAAGSSDVDITMNITVQHHTVTATGGGSFDYRRRLGQMHLAMSGLGLGDAGEIQEIMTPTALYMRMPSSMGGTALGGRPWLMIRFADFKQFGVDYAKIMNQSSGSDPASMLRMLSSATQIHRGGTATIDGVRTTEYTADSTFLDLVRAEGLGSAVDLSKLPAGMADTQIHYSVWLDKSGLPRRMRMKMAGGAFAGGAMDMTMTFLHYGTAVSVSAPPSSLVTDMSSLLKQNGG